jgi:hypothetical protein
MTRTGQAGLLVAALLVLLGVVQPTGAQAVPHGSVVVEPASTGQAWQDSLHTVRDQPLRLAAAQHVPPVASDTWWAVPVPPPAGGPPHGHSPAATAAGRPSFRGTPPPRSPRAPPAE